MTPPVSPEASAPLCSELSARIGLPLIGSAGHYHRILAFELRSPWTPRLVGSRGCNDALDAAIVRIAAEAPMVRLLALEPKGTADTSRVLEFSRASGPFSSYERREYAVATAELASALEQLALDGHSHRPCAPSTGRDILVCTHGTRDACCGKFGYPLYRELEGLAAAWSGQPVQVWRCSHLGGHRFAPTLLDLPSGRMFGRVSLPDAPVLLSGGGPLVERLGDIYRGRCALPEAAQLVERELWKRSGPSFEHAALEWEVENLELGVAVTLRARGASASGQHELAPTAWTMNATVARAEVDVVRTPASCGRDPEPEAPWRMNW